MEPEIEVVTPKRTSAKVARVALVFGAILGLAGLVALVPWSSDSRPDYLVDMLNMPHNCPLWHRFCLDHPNCEKKYFKDKKPIVIRSKCRSFVEDCRKYCIECDCGHPRGRYCDVLEHSCKDQVGLVVEAVEAAKHPNHCPFGWEQIGEYGSGIDGCGLDKCEERDSAPSAKRCALYCTREPKCKSFSYFFDGHSQRPVCSRYATDVATMQPTDEGPYKDRVLCKKMAKAPTPVLNEECKFDVVGASFLQHDPLYPACPKGAVLFGLAQGGFCCTGTCAHGKEGAATDRICALESNPTQMYGSVRRAFCAGYQKQKYCMWAYGAKEGLDTSFMTDYIIKGQVSFKGDSAGILFRMSSSTDADAKRYWLRMKGDTNQIVLSYIDKGKDPVYVGPPGTGPVQVTYRSGKVISTKTKITKDTIKKLTDDAAALKGKETHGYCTVYNAHLGGSYNRRQCRGPRGTWHNVCAKFEAAFEAPVDGEWQFQVKADLGKGGLVLFDDDVKTATWGAGTHWIKGRVVYTRVFKKTFTAGHHKFTVYGCSLRDGFASFKFKAPGATHWLPLEQRRLKALQTTNTLPVTTNTIYDFNLRIEGGRFTLDLDGKRVGTWRDHVANKISAKHPLRRIGAGACKTLNTRLQCEKYCAENDKCKGFWYDKKFKCCPMAWWRQTDIAKWKTMANADGFYSYSKPRLTTGGMGLQTWKSSMDVHNMQFLGLDGKPMTEQDYEGYITSKTHSLLFVDGRVSSFIHQGHAKALEISPTTKMLGLMLWPPPRNRGAYVWCDLTIDNRLVDIRYGGRPLRTYKGNRGKWTSVKGIRFVDLGPGHFLEVRGHEYGNCDGCKCSGFAMRCYTHRKDSVWNNFQTSTNPNFWRARGGWAIHRRGHRRCGARTTYHWSPRHWVNQKPCQSSSAFHIGRPGKKIWKGQQRILYRRFKKYRGSTPKWQKIWARGREYQHRWRSRRRCRSRKLWTNRFASFKGSPYGFNPRKKKTPPTAFAMAVQSPMQGIMQTTKTTAKEWQCTKTTNWWHLYDRTKRKWWWHPEYDHSKWPKAHALDARKNKLGKINHLVKSVVMGPSKRNLQWIGSEEDKYTGDTVTCKLTIDNHLTSVRYDGVYLRISGNRHNWGVVKTITFKDKGPGFFLNIMGHESNNSQRGCRVSGLGLKCTVAKNTKSKWHNFVSDTKHWTAAGARSWIYRPRSFSPFYFRRPCVSRSGFSLKGQTGYTKIWPRNGRRFATFVGSPYQRSMTFCVAKFPARKYSCKEGKAGACFTYAKGLKDKESVKYSDAKYKPWGVKQARDYCMAKAGNKDLQWKDHFAPGECNGRHIAGKGPQAPRIF